MVTTCPRTDPHGCILGRHLGPPAPVPDVAMEPPARLLALDPGTTRSAWIALDGRTLRPLGFGIEPNEGLVERLRAGREAFDLVVIEKVESFGMAVGEEVFETVFWSGRFAEAVVPVPVARLGRRAVKLAICGDSRAKDPNIRQASSTATGARSEPSARSTCRGPSTRSSGTSGLHWRSGWPGSSGERARTPPRPGPRHWGALTRPRAEVGREGARRPDRQGGRRHRPGEPGHDPALVPPRAPARIPGRVGRRDPDPRGPAARSPRATGGGPVVRLLRVPEVAERLALGVSTVYALIDRGELPHVRFGRSVRVREDHLQGYVERESVGHGPAATEGQGGRGGIPVPPDAARSGRDALHPLGGPDQPRRSRRSPDRTARVRDQDRGEGRARRAAPTRRARAAAERAAAWQLPPTVAR